MTRRVLSFLWHPLFMLALLVVATFTILINFATDSVDNPLAKVSIVTYLSTVLRMLFTPWSQWTVLGAGLIASFLGTAMLLALVIDPSLNRDTFSPGVWLWIVRSLLAVGGPLTLVGFILELRDRHVERNLIGKESQ